MIPPNRPLRTLQATPCGILLLRNGHLSTTTVIVSPNQTCSRIRIEINLYRFSYWSFGIRTRSGIPVGRPITCPMNGSAASRNETLRFEPADVTPTANIAGSLYLLALALQYLTICACCASCFSS